MGQVFACPISIRTHFTSHKSGNPGPIHRNNPAVEQLLILLSTGLKESFLKCSTIPVRVLVWLCFGEEPLELDSSFHAAKSYPVIYLVANLIKGSILSYPGNPNKGQLFDLNQVEQC